MPGRAAVRRAPRAGAHVDLVSAISATDDDTPASGRACRCSFMGVSFGSPRSLPGSVTKLGFNTGLLRSRQHLGDAHQAVAADEVLGLRLTRRGLQPLRELLVAHAFVVPEHAAVGGDGQVRHVGLDRLHSIQTQMLMRIIIDCPWFCVIWQHRWNNPALPGHSPPRAGD